MPRAEPWLEGLTTSGKPSRASIGASVSAAPRLRKAVSLKATKSGVGMPASSIRCLARTLSVARMQASTPEPV